MMETQSDQGQALFASEDKKKDIAEVKQPNEQNLMVDDIREQRKTYRKDFLMKLVVIASIGGFLFGYDTGIVAGAQLFFKNDFEISEIEKDLVVSLAQLGALVAGPLSDKFGRKPIVILADLFFTLGSVLMYVAPSVPVLMSGRLVVGLGVGLASLVVPVYLAEISPVEVRGIVVAVDCLVITSGQFIASGVSLLLGENWRLMLGLGAIPAMLQLLGMLMMPESQRWLSKTS
jgi:SP family myo-inositol transporter-like MFS transporter 13